MVEKLQSANVGSIFDYAAEADLGEQVPVGAQGEVDSTHADYVKGDDVSINDKNSADTNLVVPLEYNEATPVARINTYVGEDMCDAHVAVFEKCIEAVHTVSPNGFAAIKLTALGPPELLRRVSTALVEVRNLFDKFDQDRTGTISEAEFEAGYRKYFTDDRAKMDALMATFPRVAVEADGCPGKSIDFIEWSSTLQLKNLAELCMDCKDSGPLKMAVPTEVELQAAEDAFARVDKLAALAKVPDSCCFYGGVVMVVCLCFIEVLMLVLFFLSCFHFFFFSLFFFFHSPWLLLIPPPPPASLFRRKGFASWLTPNRRTSSPPLTPRSTSSSASTTWGRAHTPCFPPTKLTSRTLRHDSKTICSARNGKVDE